MRILSCGVVNEQESTLLHFSLKSLLSDSVAMSFLSMWRQLLKSVVQIISLEFPKDESGSNSQRWISRKKRDAVQYV